MRADCVRDTPGRFRFSNGVGYVLAHVRGGRALVGLPVRVVIHGESDEAAVTTAATGVRPRREALGTRRIPHGSCPPVKGHLAVGGRGLGRSGTHVGRARATAAWNSMVPNVVKSIA